MLNVDMDISMNIIRKQGNTAYNIDIFIHAAWTLPTAWTWSSSMGTVVQHGYGSAAWVW
jgi:hypothetical protein